MTSGVEASWFSSSPWEGWTSGCGPSEIPKIWVWRSLRGPVVTVNLSGGRRVDRVVDCWWLGDPRFKVNDDFLRVFEVRFLGVEGSCFWCWCCLRCFYQETFWLIDRIWIGVELWFIRLIIQHILVWDEIANTHALDSLCLVGASLANNVTWVWEYFHDIISTVLEERLELGLIWLGVILGVE